MTEAVTQTRRPGFRESKGRWDRDRSTGLAYSSRQDPISHGEGEYVHMWLFINLTCMQMHTLTGECACAHHTHRHNCFPNFPDISDGNSVKVEK